MTTGPLHSYIIEQVLGLYMLIMAIIMIARADYYRKVVRDLSADKNTVFVSAMFALIFGLIMVVIHNIWEWRFELLATIIAWVVLLKAIFWLALPEYMLALSRKVYKDNMYYVMAVIAGIIGIILLIHAYHSFGGDWAFNLW
ncbi:Integral membrane protein (PIN domain superfamily) [Legionella busanensis]|uniref:Integral membrane protein (PIN domain superfamily) n=1 Tax=Legionella busanensis TaxID=190655 RepID=A0A378JUC1_9GAMM|nr:hypothetical protein [Legionella busanensis]STX51802.1 Integral membrane protein (PIN domain superfamily) [Legionella busanensis]